MTIIGMVSPEFSMVSPEFSPYVAQGVNSNATYDAQDRLLTYGDNSYSYTANGELQSKTNSIGATQYTYDSFGNA